MSKDKISFTTFLEFNSALPTAYSANILSSVPNEKDEEDDNSGYDPDPNKRLEMLKKAIAKKNPDQEGDDASGDEEIFSILKSFLGGNEVEDEHPSEVDHDEMEDIDAGNGEQSELDPDNIGPFKPNDDVNDQPHAGDTADAKLGDEKHAQLMSAINDLRQELQSSKAGTSQPQEEDEADEEDDQEGTNYQSAQQLFTAMVNQKKPRQAIIAQMMKQIGVTDSTATSYYQRLAKDAGITNSGDREMADPSTPQLGVAAGFDPAQGGMAQGQDAGQQMGAPPESKVDGVEVEGDANRQGLIRNVKGAHLVYKRKNEEGTFDELWNFSTGDDMKNTLQVRRAILAGTDIPPRATKSEDGSQSYTLTSLGNGQLLNIKGLPN